MKGMTEGEARQRVADALKPKRQRQADPAPEPPDDDDLLLGAGADPADAPDEVATWALDPVTRMKLKELRTIYVARAKQLFGQALASTDPKVAVLGGQVNALALAISRLGGKV